MARGRAVKSKKPRKPKSKGLETIFEEKWATLKSFGAFVVNDPETDEPHSFKRDEIVAILPEGRDPAEQHELPDYWIGKIKDIRAFGQDADGSNSVWAKVQWFYSGKDVNDVIKSFDQSAVTPYERVFSDHTDFVAPESFDGAIKMIKFDETDPEQVFIRRDQFFRRYTLEYKARNLKPKPGASACMCMKPYNPNDMSALSVMHFCPRPSCRRAYHQSCLLSAKSKESSSAEAASTALQNSVRATRSARKHASPVKKPTRTKPAPGPEPLSIAASSAKNRALRLLACSPDTDDTVDLESLIPLTVVHIISQGNGDDNGDEPPKKKRRGRPPRMSTASQTQNQAQTEIQEPRTLSSILKEVPSELLEIAQQPLIRGGAFIKGGVSGNIGFVTRARRLLYQILEGNREPAAEWEEDVFGNVKEVDVDNAIVKITGSKKPLPPVVCPHCKSAI